MQTCDLCEDREAALNWLPIFGRFWTSPIDGKRPLSQPIPICTPCYKILVEITDTHYNAILIRTAREVLKLSLKLAPTTTPEGKP